jgi:hypothetical protein
MNFSKAWQKCLDGVKIARSGWNGRDQYIFIHLPYPPTGDDVFYYKPYAEIKNSQNEIFPWTPSQGDLFADDWVVFD